MLQDAWLTTRIPLTFFHGLRYLDFHVRDRHQCHKILFVCLILIVRFACATLDVGHPISAIAFGTHYESVHFCGADDKQKEETASRKLVIYTSAKSANKIDLNANQRFHGRYHSLNTTRPDLNLYRSSDDPKSSNQRNFYREITPLPVKCVTPVDEVASAQHCAQRYLAFGGDDMAVTQGRCRRRRHMKPVPDGTPIRDSMSWKPEMAW
jgi:hypothetical protein